MTPELVIRPATPMEIRMNLPTPAPAHLPPPTWEELAEKDGAIDADGREPAADPDWVADGSYGQPATATSPGPHLLDVTDSMGTWNGLILGQIDFVLASLNDGDWKGQTREIVLDHVGQVMVDLFAEGEHERLYASSVDQLNLIAARHMAQYIVVKSLAERKKNVPA